MAVGPTLNPLPTAFGGGDTRSFTLPATTCFWASHYLPARKLNDGRSLRKISAAFAEQGFVTPSSRTYSARAVQSMLSGEGSRSQALKRTDAKGRRILA